MNIKDLAGQRFGRLVAAERTNQKHARCYLWRCKCDCGQETLVSTHFLIRGIRKSCGCLAHETRTNDLTGQRFGRLTAVASTESRKHNCIVWECRCDCGTTVHVRSTNLVAGIRKSCGCLHIESAKHNAQRAYTSNLQDNTNVGLIKSRALAAHNTSGHKGVSWHRGVGMWQARLQFQGTMHSLGYFTDIDKAVAARREAEEKYFAKYLKSRRQPPSEIQSTTERC